LKHGFILPRAVHSKARSAHIGFHDFANTPNIGPRPCQPKFILDPLLHEICNIFLAPFDVVIVNEIRLHLVLNINIPQNGVAESVLELQLYLLGVIAEPSICVKICVRAQLVCVDHVVLVIHNELVLLFYREVLEDLVSCSDLFQDVRHRQLVRKFVSGFLKDLRSLPAEHILEAKVNRAAKFLEDGV